MVGVNDLAMTRIRQILVMFARALDDAKANRQTGEGRTRYENACRWFPAVQRIRISVIL